jgi:hypothetical protein
MASSSIQESHHFSVGPTCTVSGTAFLHRPSPLSRTTPRIALSRRKLRFARGRCAACPQLRPSIFSSRRAPCAPEHVIRSALWQSSRRADENLLFGVGPSQVRSGDPHDSAPPRAGLWFRAAYRPQRRSRVDSAISGRPALRRRTGYTLTSICIRKGLVGSFLHR